MKRGKVRKSKKNLKISGIKDFLNNKRLLAVTIAAFFICIIVLSFVSFGGQVPITSAATGMEFMEGVTAVGDSVIQLLTPIFTFLLGEVGEGLLYAKVLFFIIVLGIVWLSLKQVDFFNEHKPVLIIIALAVSILAVRGISETALINMILLPYSVLGVALTAGLPFVIYFIMVDVGLKDQPPIVRRIAWIFFAVIFIGLWISRRGDLKEFNYIYLIAVVGAVLMALMDRTIQKFFSKIEREKFKNLSKREKIVKLKNLRDDADRQDDKVLRKYYNKKLKKLIR